MPLLKVQQNNRPALPASGRFRVGLFSCVVGKPGVSHGGPHAVSWRLSLRLALPFQRFRLLAAPGPADALTDTAIAAAVGTGAAPRSPVRFRFLALAGVGVHAPPKKAPQPGSPTGGGWCTDTHGRFCIGGSEWSLPMCCRTNSLKKKAPTFRSALELVEEFGAYTIVACFMS